MMRFIATLIVTGIGLAIGWMAWLALSFLSVAPSEEKTEVFIDVAPGMTFNQVARNLEQQGIITSARKFYYLGRVLGQTGGIKVGEYRLATDMRPREVLSIITSGVSVHHQVVIPEGYNIFEIKDALNVRWPARGDEFFRLVTDRDFVKKLTGRDLSSLEGYLFPDTYMITKFTAMEELIRRMYENFKKNLEEVLKDSKLKMALHDHVTLASVIEKETGAEEERPIISSVYHNRLMKGMRLQADPTIIYGMMVESGQPVKNIRRSDILRPTPYNTYTIKALPVGPIANPGREALWSALNPADTKYIYFVSKNDGTHIFSETLQEHNAAVKKFQLDRKAREGKSWRDLNKSKSASQ